MGAALGVAALLSGCAGAQADDVGDVASAFEDPAGDPGERCALLVPATLAALESEESAPCADVISRTPLEGGRRVGGGLGR